MDKKINPVVICILDGIGENPNKEYNAVKLANTPTLTRLLKEDFNTLIRTDDKSVGLPSGQMGNSEVGHTNIGAGRIVLQDLPRINKSIADKEFFENPTLNEIAELGEKSNSTVHIMGLFSDGGIHSHINHFLAATEFFAKYKINVILHLFTDGRDTPPESVKNFLTQAKDFINTYNNVKIGTIIGRYYVMDRDKRWDRTEAAYNALLLGKGEIFNTPEEAINNGYQDLINQKRIPSDEFIKPSVINGYQGIKDNDIIFMVNFRADRVRQILMSILDPNFNEFSPLKTVKLLKAIGMTSYSRELDKLLVTVFPEIKLKNTLGEIIANHDLKQLRAAETEKYPHVTFFFNGGRETRFPGEERILIPSPKVATYDLKPEMSAYTLKDSIVEALNSKKFDLIVVNFANCDMVGHTGVLDAAIKAVETVDKCLGEIENAIKVNGYSMLITADHGNCENMWDYKNNSPHTQHTTNPVRLIVVNPPKDIKIKSLKNNGKLADIAPTVLDIMGIEKPKEMTGIDLIEK